MKNSDEMIRDVHRRIGEYEAAKKQRRSNLLKMTAAAVPVCAAAAVAIGIYSRRPQHELLTNAPAAGLSDYEIQTGAQDAADGSDSITETAAETSAELALDLTQTPQAEENPQTVTDAVPVIESDAVSTETKPDTPILTESEKQTTAMLPKKRCIFDETILTEPAEQISPVQTGAASGNDVFLREGDEPTQFYKLIRSYPVMAQYCYDAADNGECFRSVPLSDAMDEYGDSVHYYLQVHLFRDGDLITDSAALSAEAERLYAAGYTPAIETVNGNETVFTLNATYDQILNFPVESDHGYFLYLRDEMG